MSSEKNLNSYFLSFRKMIMKYISGMVPPGDIEDIVQDTYVKVCQFKDKDSIQHPRSFILKIAKNIAIDHLKKAETRLTSTMDTEELIAIIDAKYGDSDTLKKTIDDEEFSFFCEAVRYLPVQTRRAFVLKKVYGFTQKEIAEFMNITESTVEKHIANGIKRCTNYMIHASTNTRHRNRIYTLKHSDQKSK